MLKRTVIGLFTAILSMAAYAAELQLPPTALSNVPPNDLKVVVVAEFTGDSRVGQNPMEMTVRELSNRPTIGSKIDKRLCVVESDSNPVQKSGGMCVSAQINPATVKVATFDNATGKPINTREIPRGDFYEKRYTRIAMISPNGPIRFKCLLADDGHNTGTCTLEGQ